MSKNILELAEILQKAFSSEASPIYYGNFQFKVVFKLEDILIGQADLLVQISEKKVYWQQFYPFFYAEQDNGVDLRGFGLGTLAHMSVLNHLKQVSGIDSYHVVHGGTVEDTGVSQITVTNERKAHLGKMGIEWSQPMLFSDYYKKSLAYAVRLGINLL